MDRAMKGEIELDNQGKDKWEEVPDEDLWEDGEISMTLVRDKILQHVLQIGDWKLMRRKI